MAQNAAIPDENRQQKVKYNFTTLMQRKLISTDACQKKKYHDERLYKTNPTETPRNSTEDLNTKSLQQKVTQRNVKNQLRWKEDNRKTHSEMANNRKK